MNNPPFSRISDMLDSVSFHLECNYRQCVLVAEAYEKSGMKSLANVYWHKAAVYAEAIRLKKTDLVGGQGKEAMNKPQCKELEKCPYCGEMELHFMKTDHAFGERISEMWHVVCPGCAAFGPLHKEISMAVALWDTVSKAWYGQSVTVHMPPAMEVSQTTCDELRRENELLEKMISERDGES